MPDTKISALAAVGAAADAQEFPVNDAGTTKKITLLTVDNYILRALHVPSTALAANSVTDAKLRDSAGTSVIGKAGAGAGDPADIAAGADDRVFGRRAGSLTFAQVATAEIANLAITTGLIANDAVDDTKAGNRVPQFYRRQGGNAADWGSLTMGGTTNYTPTSVRMQGGYYEGAFGAANSGNFTITFPVSFSDQPIVIATPSSDKVILNVGKVAGAGADVVVYWRTYDGSNIAAIGVYWLAIGPE